jgi:hypothetical protein
MHVGMSVGFVRGTITMRRPRLTIRRMMILIAVIAAASLAGRSFWDWRFRTYNPIFGSDLNATASDVPDFEPGRTAPVRVVYNFALSPHFKTWAGATVTVVGSVWLEDAETRRYVDGYTFAVPLTDGGRESAYGDFVWDALPPHAGHYYIHHTHYYSMPLGGLNPGWLGGSTLWCLGPPEPEPGEMP